MRRGGSGVRMTRGCQLWTVFHGAAAFARRSISRRSSLFLGGGWGGIRTHEELAPPPVFKTGAFNRSATHPCMKNQILIACMPRTIIAWGGICHRIAGEALGNQAARLPIALPPGKSRAGQIAGRADRGPCNRAALLIRPAPEYRPG